MRNRARLLALSLLASGLVLPGAPPAASHTVVCAGLGAFVLTTEMGIPALSDRRHNTFTAHVDVGECPPSFEELRASGTITGWCGLASGMATTETGHQFAFIVVGGVLVVTGTLVGTGAIYEDPMDTPSCLAGNAARFIVAFGALVFHPTTCTSQPVPFPTGGLPLAEIHACV